jgi:hypothetical protein
MKKMLPVFFKKIALQKILFPAALLMMVSAYGQVQLWIPESGDFAFGSDPRSSYTYNTGDKINYLTVSGGVDGSEITVVGPRSLTSSTSNRCDPAERRIQTQAFELELVTTSASKIVLTGTSNGTSPKYLRQLIINGVVTIADGNDPRIKSFLNVTNNTTCGDITVEGISAPVGAKLTFIFANGPTGSVQNYNLSTITITPDPLAPVRLLDFNAMRRNNVAEITWRVANESEGRSFGVERSSDGRVFENIFTTHAVGLGRYSFVDNTQKPGRIAYYRLQMLNRDGSIAYSDIKAVNFDGKGALEVFPNPVRNGDKLFTTFAPTTKNAMIRVLNASGQVVQSLQVTPFTEQAQLNTNNLRSGVYMLQIISGNDVQTTRFVKE